MFRMGNNMNKYYLLKKYLLLSTVCMCVLYGTEAQARLAVHTSGSNLSVNGNYTGSTQYWYLAETDNTNIFTKTQTFKEITFSKTGSGTVDTISTSISSSSTDSELATAKSVYEAIQSVSGITESELEAALTGKADASDLTALQTTVASKANQSDLTALETTVNSKADASDLTALQTTVAGKANQSDLTTLQGTVSTLSSAVDGKADASDLTALQTTVASKANQSDLTTLQGTVSTLSSAIDDKADASDLTALQTTVAGKANQSDLTTLQGTVSTLSSTVDSKADASDLTALQTTVASKANQSDLTALETTVNSKADASDLTALQTTVAGKANQADLTALETTVNSKADASDLTALQTTVAGKANQSDLTTLQGTVSTLSSTVDSKADASDLTALQTTVAGKADASNVYTKDEADGKYATQTAISDMLTKTEASGTYATQSALNDYKTSNDNAVSALTGRMTQAETDISDISNSAVMTSGITAEKVATYEGYAALIDAKQDALSTEQIAVLNSGITAADIATVQTANARLDTMDTTITNLNNDFGDVADFSGSTTGNLQNDVPSSSTQNASTVTKAIANMDATVGQIHGLAAKVGVANGGGNLGQNTTVEEHLTALAGAIGDRSNYTEQNYISNNQTVAKSLDNLDIAVGSMRNDFTSAQVANEVRFNGIEHKIDKLEDKMGKGLAANNALAGLVPLNDRYKSQVSMALGGYENNQAVAIGAFHYVTEKVLLNTGVAYGGNDSLSYNVGITLGF